MKTTSRLRLRLALVLSALIVAGMAHAAGPGDALDASGPRSDGRANGVDVRRLVSPGAASLVDPDLQAFYERAPNVVVVLLDDVGFGAASTFGGPIPTPTLERLAQGGLRYNRFHTTAICSPTRAALLTGRNPHAVGVGAVLNSASNHPGKHGVLDRDVPTLADHLRRFGYATAAIGKWHLTPDWETSPAGPFDHWPTARGFDHFYGFLGGETHQFAPTLYEGTRPVTRTPGPDYHLTTDLADEAVRWMRLQRSIRPERPFFLYFATGATHAPIHAPADWIARFRGHFDHGWDAQRERTFASQKQKGVVPAEAKLTPRPAVLPAWESFSADEKRIAARLMEVEAGFLAHTDAQIGKLVAALEQADELDDTLFVYIVGDNGASAEGGERGGWNYFAGIHGIAEDGARNLARLDAMGGPSSYPHYPAGWAWAMNTPFQWAKTIASHLGGTRNPVVVHWPKGFTARGEVRSQFAHVNDVTPTILDAIARRGLPPGLARTTVAFDGASLVDGFDDAKARSRHSTQYFEVFGHRAIYHDGWMASAFRGRAPWRVLDPMPHPIEEDRWELYDLDQDFSQAIDLAERDPRRLRKLQALFDREAKRNRVPPIGTDIPGVGLPKLHQSRDRFVYFAGAVGIPEHGAPPIANRSYTLTAAIEIPAGGAQGVVVAEGGTVAGWSLFLDANGRPTYQYNFFDVERMKIVGGEALATGPATIRYVFDANPGIGQGGRGRLFVGDRLVGEATIPRTAPRFFSIDETFDVGLDTGSPAGDYAAGSRFSGRVDRVEIELVPVAVRTAANQIMSD